MLDISLNVLIDEVSTTITQRVMQSLKLKLNIELKGLVTSLKSSQNSSVTTEATPEVSNDSIPDNTLETKPKEAVVNTSGGSCAATSEAKLKDVVTEATKPEVMPDVASTRDDDNYLQDLKTATDVDLEVLPSHYKEAILSLNKKDQFTARIFLKALNPDKWVDLIEASFEFDVDDILDIPVHEEQRLSANDYVKYVFEKVVKNGKKISRAKELIATNLKKLEETRKKRVALLEKQKATKDAESARKKAASEVIPQVKPELYIPIIDKKLRSKIVIVGLLPAQQSMFENEYRNTFIMTMMDSAEGHTKLKQLTEAKDKRVFCMADFISHSHSDNVDKSCLSIVRGGFTHLREALSNYANEVYPK